MGPIKTLPVAA